MMRRPRPNAVVCRRGLTLVEAVLASMIVSGLLLASMQAVAMSSMVQHKAAQRATASGLANSLMMDVMALAYEEPTAAPVFGRETGEPSNAKTNYDDVDDYHGWTESPPQDRDGAIIPKLERWERRVAVAWINPLNTTQVSATATGAKRMTITIRVNNQVILTRVAIRTRSF